MIPPDGVPEDARKAIKHWSQWIDCWAVDWNHKEDTFHTYGELCAGSSPTRRGHTYLRRPDYTVVVKVGDILGNDRQDNTDRGRMNGAA